ncbi:hypothetical protein SISSUDRAFT_157245 [Sistotremastrum suecicum HHB10207 ss-3]|uniref:MutL C-terminal dimerisation domain-containing protein n=1 Tax=Sistotremastrum suecicum HHB10207 ss-3 TaxID=1314776 RepID=A0A166AQI2_9AGAM|nr:hypothetical protein SISSUDRAFT_157245 [Sistotremastrum suecicum HHB10207 ss-3]
MSSGDIHHAIETRFAWSSFSKHAFDEEGITQSPRPATRRSPRKNERRPVYVINLDVPPSQFDNCIDPNKSLVQFKNLQDVVTFVLNAVQDFLVLHGFANPVDRSPVASLRGSPRKRARRDSKGISLVHEGIGASPMNSPCSYRSVRAEAHAYQESAIFNSCTDQSFLPLNGSYQDEDVFLSSTRRGSLFPSHTGKKSGGLENPPDRYTLTTKSTKIHDTVSETTKDTPAWLSNVLSRNGAYTSSESRAPSINPIANPLAPTPKNSRHNMKTISALLQGRGTDISRRITRSDLASAQVISQVDTKFIACLIRSSPDHGRHQDNLILIDQHAADERVRVERFLDDLCTSYLRGQVQRRTLAPEKLILATECERRLLSRDDIREAFSKWGFSFNLPPVASSGGYGLDEESDTYVQVGVESVPDIIGDKLLLADELKDFVKNYVSKLEGGDIQEYPTQEPIDLDTLSSEGPVWLKALRFCPPELLDLVNSKACRGAIMFNDPLELDQCERLVSQLSKTVYPFQCAHGRPTLVPLTAIDGPKSYARPVDWGRLDA